MIYNCEKKIDLLENGWLKKKINLVDNPAKKTSIETLRHGVTWRLTLLHGVWPNNSLSTRHNAALSERILEFSLVYAEQLWDDDKRVLVGHTALAVIVNALVLKERQVSEV